MSAPFVDKLNIVFSTASFLFFSLMSGPVGNIRQAKRLVRFFRWDVLCALLISIPSSLVGCEVVLVVQEQLIRTLQLGQETTGINQPIFYNVISLPSTPRGEGREGGRRHVCLSHANCRTTGVGSHIPRQILGEFLLRVRPAARTLGGERMPCSGGVSSTLRQLLVYKYPTDRRCCGRSPMTMVTIGRDAGSPRAAVHPAGWVLFQPPVRYPGGGRRAQGSG